MTDTPRNQLRIPTLPLGPMVDANGQATPDELNFRQSLLSLLQQIMGNEGLVMPQQPTANVTIIQNHISQVPDGNTGNYLNTNTCQYGTLIYEVNDDSPTPNPLKDEVVVAVNNGSGSPIFKQVVLLDTQTLEPTAGAIAGYVDVTFLGVAYKIALYAP